MYYKGHYLRLSHKHYSHFFYVMRCFPRTLHIFFRSHISLVTSVSTVHKKMWGLTKKCVNRGLLTQKIVPTHKKLTEWSEWQEWYVLNSYEHKDCAHLRVRPVQNLNSILRHICLSVLNSYFKLKLTNEASVLTKGMFAQQLLTRYCVNAFKFICK